MASTPAAGRGWGCVITGALSWSSFFLVHSRCFSYCLGVHYPPRSLSPFLQCLERGKSCLQSGVGPVTSRPPIMMSHGLSRRGPPIGSTPFARTDRLSRKRVFITLTTSSAKLLRLRDGEHFASHLIQPR